MPGCTVPNCTNSSQKGFKLYRFPSDKERNLIWVQNCGRERGWNPTKHTCVCEVHFEESQFESHRADGLRKLKPNAIPTIFSHLPYIRSYTRKPKKNVVSENTYMSSQCDFKLNSVPETKTAEVESNLEEVGNECSDENVVIKEPDHTYPKYYAVEDRVEISNDDTATTEEVFINVSVASKPNDIPEIPGKERRFRPIKRIKDGTGEWTLKTCQSRKRSKPADSSTNLHNSASKKMIKMSVTDKEELQIQEGIEDISSSNVECSESSNVEEKECFVCGKVLEKGLSLFTLTNTTKVYMYQKLDKIVTGELDLVLKKEGILCSRCANLLNYMDRIEVELNMLKKAILNCIRKKCGMEFKSDNGQEKLLANVDEAEDIQNNLNVEVESRVEFDHQSTHKENEENSVKNSLNIHEQQSNVEGISVEEIQCQICKFKSIYKSVIIFHLRQHLKDVYWCDFCNVPLPDDAINCIGKDDDNLLIGRNDSGDEEILTLQEEEVDVSNNSQVTKNCNVSSDSSDVLVTVVPVNAEDTVTSKIVEAVACRNYSVDENSVDIQECLENTDSRKNTKHIRILNEMGKIVMQEVPISEGPEVKNNDEDMSGTCVFSQLSFHSKPVELQMLGEAKGTELNYDDPQINQITGVVENYQIKNKVEMVLTGGEERQLFKNSDVG